MKNRLQKIEKAINNMSDDKFNELLNELGVKVDKQWEPEYEERYWTNLGTGIVHDFYWVNSSADNYRLLMNNVFKTEEEAEAQRDFNIEKAKLIKEIEDSSDVIDWEDLGQEKYSMYYIHDEGIIDTDMNRVFEKQGVTYTTNRAFLKKLIANEPERVKKYLFGVGE
jgi:hypothetical protein